jgi:hypothetical protein
MSPILTLQLHFYRKATPLSGGTMRSKRRRGQRTQEAANAHAPKGA